MAHFLWKVYVNTTGILFILYTCAPQDFNKYSLKFTEKIPKHCAYGAEQLKRKLKVDPFMKI